MTEKYIRRSLRNLDMGLYLKARAIAAEGQVTTGEVYNWAMKAYLDSKKGRK